MRNSSVWSSCVLGYLMMPFHLCFEVPSTFFCIRKLFSYDFYNNLSSIQRLSKDNKLFQNARAFRKPLMMFPRDDGSSVLPSFHSSLKSFLHRSICIFHSHLITNDPNGFVSPNFKGLKLSFLSTLLVCALSFVR